MQPAVVKISVKNDEMEMSGHDHKGIDAQLFMNMAVVKAICDDFAGGFGYEDGKPIDDGKGEVVEANALLNAVAFHIGLTITGRLRETAGITASNDGRFYNCSGQRPATFPQTRVVA